MFQWFKIRRRLPETRAITSKDIVQFFQGEESLTGIPISARTVLGNPAVKKAVDLISSRVAKPSYNVYTRSDDGSRSKDSQHPAHKLLNRKPSPLYNPFVFKKSLVADALLYPGGYAWIRRDVYGEPLELVKLDPALTYLHSEAGDLYFMTTVSDQQWALPLVDVISIHGLSPDALQGWSILDTQRDSFALGLALLRFGATYFKNNCRPSRTYTLPLQICNNEPKKREFLDGLYAMHSGIANSNRPGWVPDGVTFVDTEVDNENSQFLQSREFALKETANAFSLSYNKVGCQISTSYKSLTEENRAVLGDCYDPWITTMEEEFTAKLLKETEKEDKYIEGDREMLVDIDTEIKIPLIIQQVEAGLMSKELACQKLNLPKPPEEPKPEPQQQPAVPTEDMAQAMTQATINRMLRRICKSVEHGKYNLGEHKDIFAEQLAHPNATQFIETFIRNTQEELDAVLPEQRLEVVRNLDAITLNEELWI